MKKNYLLILIGLSLLVMVGCQNNSSQKDPNKIQVVATTTMLTDLVENIGGDKVQVNGLMGPGIDPHLYQASAKDVTKMQTADVVVHNGLHLEGKMGDVFEALNKRGKNVIKIKNGLDKTKLLKSEDNSSQPDPHIWFDVSMWQQGAKEVAKGLIKADPKNQATYQTNLDRYLAELVELDQYMMNKVQELPKEKRILVTAHDAFRYFGQRYDFEVVGLQGISTQAEAGTGDMRKLADFIVKHQIKAVFVESSVPTKTIEALQAATKAKGFDVKIGGELYSDSLGDEKHDTATYIKTLKANTDTIVNALK
ncbi:manganese transporter [Carnobacterium divergens]|uniref:metal ABC transporter solute-binding protein, Zn/Mn family n=1 Tax=Carnobacterium divergens TaxID=2748 RepID=UPI001071DE8A|nr:zinc ABC transporter substrate-binding protein [Carnobacterium divergens]TFJ38934.1 manganese transporter [Carnobacterium divergens]TFJ48169.1 manganese transporter [Carnobacterium divergens]TFJ53133.1 manganese transporter [Carnobacterium divergens]TFJ57220.1 manganese transporter [Carnobacterium divergens]TFJ68923.1 manganese transporter [Carnobacterium divergens]